MTFPLPPPQVFPGPTSLLIFLPLPPLPHLAQGHGKWGCSQFIILPLWHSFLLTLFACMVSLLQDNILHELLQCKSFPRAAVLRERLQHDGTQFLPENLLLSGFLCLGHGERNNVFSKLSLKKAVLMYCSGL